MAGQKDRPLLHSDDAMRRRHVVGQRTQRVLNRDRLKSALRQKGNDLCPARAVCERPMDEHYGFDCHVDFSSVMHGHSMAEEWRTIILPHRQSELPAPQRSWRRAGDLYAVMTVFSRVARADCSLD